MTAILGIRMKHPAHPGGFVRNGIVAPLGLSVTHAAAALGVTRAALSALLNERTNLSPEMAPRIEEAFGVSMDMLMQIQNSYDIAETGKRAGTIVIALFARRRIGAISTRSRNSLITW